MNITSKFKVGDRVCRESKGVMRHGAIAAVNRGHKDYKDQYMILYAVLWDDTQTVEQGYLEIANGLIREETK